MRQLWLPGVSPDPAELRAAREALIEVMRTAVRRVGQARSKALEQSENSDGVAE
jgi:hypothetical protein